MPGPLEMCVARRCRLSTVGSHPRRVASILPLLGAAMVVGIHPLLDLLADPRRVMSRRVTPELARVKVMNAAAGKALRSVGSGLKKMLLKMRLGHVLAQCGFVIGNCRDRRCPSCPRAVGVHHKVLMRLTHLEPSRAHHEMKKKLERMRSEE